MTPIKIGAIVTGSKEGESKSSGQGGSLQYPYPEEHQKFIEAMERIKKS